MQRFPGFVFGIIKGWSYDGSHSTAKIANGDNDADQRRILGNVYGS